jgi:hypothetical protein
MLAMVRTQVTAIVKAIIGVDKVDRAEGVGTEATNKVVGTATEVDMVVSSEAIVVVGNR